MITSTRYFVLSSKGKYLQGEQSAPRALTPGALRFNWTPDRELGTRFVSVPESWITYFFKHHAGVVTEMTITEVPK